MRTRSLDWWASQHQGEGTGPTPWSFIKDAGSVAVLVGIECLLSGVVIAGFWVETLSVLSVIAIPAMLTVGTWITTLAVRNMVSLPRTLWSCWVGRRLRQDQESQLGGAALWDEWTDLPM